MAEVGSNAERADCYKKSPAHAGKKVFVVQQSHINASLIFLNPSFPLPFLYGPVAQSVRALL